MTAAGRPRRGTRSTIDARSCSGRSPSPTCSGSAGWRGRRARTTCRARGTRRCAPARLRGRRCSARGAARAPGRAGTTCRAARGGWRSSRAGTRRSRRPGWTGASGSGAPTPTGSARPGRAAARGSSRRVRPSAPARGSRSARRTRVTTRRPAGRAAVGSSGRTALDVGGAELAPPVRVEEAQLLLAALDAGVRRDEVVPPGGAGALRAHAHERRRAGRSSPAGRRAGDAAAPRGGRDR